MPDEGWFVTHYHRSDRRPFQNLSDLDDEAAGVVLAGLTEGSRRRFGHRYLQLRRQTEAEARRLFIEQGGRPIRLHPHYFVLGESRWFAGLYDDPQEVRLPLSRLPERATSFTWTDSMTALGLGRSLGVPDPHEDWQRGVHLIGQLAPERLPPQPVGSEISYEGYQHSVLDHYVEVQLWDDEPVQELLRP